MVRLFREVDDIRAVAWAFSELDEGHGNLLRYNLDPRDRTARHLFNDFNELSNKSGEFGPFAPSAACEKMKSRALSEPPLRGTLSYEIDKKATFHNFTRYG